MWIETDDGPVLGLHLGMAGRIVIDDDAAGDYWSDDGAKHLPVWDRFTLHFADGGLLALRDKRRLGRAVLEPGHLAPRPGRRGGRSRDASATASATARRR